MEALKKGLTATASVLGGQTTRSSSFFEAVLSTLTWAHGPGGAVCYECGDNHSWSHVYDLEVISDRVVQAKRDRRLDKIRR